MAKFPNNIMDDFLSLNSEGLLKGISMHVNKIFQKNRFINQWIRFSSNYIETRRLELIFVRPSQNAIYHVLCA